MKNINPLFYLLNSYKNFLELNYDNSFILTDKDSFKKKTYAFAKSIYSLMDIKDYTGYAIKSNNEGVNIFYKNTLIVTYKNDFLYKIKTESQLKMHLLIEWGNLLEFSKKENKEQLLLAI